jgi:TPR repeat protein
LVIKSSNVRLLPLSFWCAAPTLPGPTLDSAIASQIKEWRCCQVRSWWWPATLLLAAGTAVLTTLGKVPTLPGWIAAGIAMIAGLATATMSDVVRARLRWLVERGPTAAAALRNGFLLTSRGRIPRVEDVGALALGVYRAMRVNEEKTAELPPYVKRDLDIELDDLLRLGGLVVIEGKSAAGKTRTAVEAMRRVLAGRKLLVPRDGAALRALVGSGMRLKKVVIWLDDLERFLTSGGLDVQLITKVCPPGQSDVVMLATIRSQARIDMVSVESVVEAELARNTAEVLAEATTRMLDRQLSPSELQRAEALRGDARIADALDHADEIGLAEYLCAGPAILARWLSGRDADGGVALVGAALISAAVDCRRAGCESPLPRVVLAELYSHYLDPRDAHRPNRPSIEDGLVWATESVRGASSCLVPHGGDRYLAFDYLVDPPTRLLNVKPVSEPVWTVLLAHLDPRELNLVGLAAFKAGQEDIGRQILVRWAESTDDPAIWHWVGTFFLWRPKAAWQQRSTAAEPWLVRAAEVGHPDSVRQLAMLYGARGDTAAAERWSQRGAEAGDAYAMVYLGEILEERGHLAEAKQWYRRAAESGPVEAERVLIEVKPTPISLPPMSFRFAKPAGDYLEFECARLTAMTLLGLLHARCGDDAEALRWLRRAASYGYMNDLLALGAFFSDRGDRQILSQWCDQAAELGRLDAVVELGVQLATQHMTIDAQRLFSYAADAGRSDAAGYLGQFYHTQGDYAEAERQYRIAESAHPEVKEYLANLQRRREEVRGSRNSIRARPPSL